jgi:hypothetical protein
MDTIKVYETLNECLIPEISKIVIKFLFISRLKPLYMLYNIGLRDCQSHYLIGMYVSLQDAIYKVKDELRSNIGLYIKPDKFKIILKKAELSLRPNCDYDHYDDENDTDFNEYEKDYDRYIAEDIKDKYDDNESSLIGEFNLTYYKYTIERNSYISL